MKWIGLLYIFSLCVSCVFTHPNACPKTLDDVLNIHFIPHTHDDVGWLKTVDQYYYGTRKDINNEGVQYILDSIIASLLEDESRRFIFVEMAFFWRWWKEQNEKMKGQVTTLVNEGRLEFINGGWSMNDEGAAHYNGIIDQMTLGLRFLNDTFGPVARPRVAWQIDPFGHSKEQANIFYNMDFEGLYFARADYADIKKRKKDRDMEMMWEGRPNASRLFTGVLPNHYVAPTRFCFDVLCSDDPIQSDPKLRGYNLPFLMKEFLAEARKESNYYKTNHVPMTMGGDFHYMDASMWYKNMDKIMEHFSNKTVLNIVYSTPSCYMDAVRRNKTVEYSVKKDDFFPYAMDIYRGYWTGYFTSRPSLKRLIRFSNNILQACKQMNAFSGLDSDKVMNLKRAVAVAQHHDAVTGTAQQHVTDDYLKRLSTGMEKCFEVMEEAKDKLNGQRSEGHNTFCPLLNITQCQFTSESTRDFYVTLYNPSSHPRNYTAYFPGNKDFYYDVQGAADVAVFPILKDVLDIPGRQSYSSHENVVHFQANNIPPMSSHTYQVNVRKNTAPNKIQQIQSNIKGEVKSKYINLILDSNGEIKGVKTPYGNFSLTIEMGFYLSTINSGAYVFRPLGQTPVIMKVLERPTIRKSGALTELFMKFSDWASVVVRISDFNKYLELDWQVGSIPVTDRGKEVIIRYRCKDIKSGSTFLTDSNGRQLMQRVRDHRDTWKLNLDIDAVSRNYYPITSYIGLEDTENRMGVLTDRSQGGTSLRSGEVELMLHRRILWDDGYGVGEPLNEIAYGKGLVCRGKQMLVFEKLESHKLSRDLGIQMYDDVITSFSHQQPSIRAKSPINPGVLPKNVHILTIETVSNGMLVRFEHYYDYNEDFVLSKPVSFNIYKLFDPNFFLIKKIREVNLSANKYKDKETSGFDISLEPMEIRSFLLN